MNPIIITRIRRVRLLAMSFIVALSLATSVALAGQQDPPQDVDLEFKASDLGLVFCEFDVGFHLVGKQGVIILSGGSFITTSPGLDATLTNLTSGASVTLNITGTIEETPLENGLVQRVHRGRNIFFDPLEGFVLLIGQFTALTDPDTNTLVQPLEGAGQKIDLCELLS